MGSFLAEEGAAGGGQVELFDLFGGVSEEDFVNGVVLGVERDDAVVV